MALMDDWRDKRNNEDFIVADDINMIARAIIIMESAFLSGKLNGYTPQKGVDYWTETDKDEIRAYIVDKLIEAKEKGDFDGADGKSAYEIALEQGFEGSESMWLESLKGNAPQRGVDYWTDEDIAEIKSYVDESILGGAW